MVSVLSAAQVSVFDCCMYIVGGFFDKMNMRAFPNCLMRCEILIRRVSSLHPFDRGLRITYIFFSFYKKSKQEILVVCLSQGRGLHRYF